MNSRDSAIRRIHTSSNKKITKQLPLFRSSDITRCFLFFWRIAAPVAMATKSFNVNRRLSKCWKYSIQKSGCSSSSTPRSLMQRSNGQIDHWLIFPRWHPTRTSVMPPLPLIREKLFNRKTQSDVTGGGDQMSLRLFFSSNIFFYFFDLSTFFLDNHGMSSRIEKDIFQNAYKAKGVPYTHIKMFSNAINASPTCAPFVPKLSEWK